MAYLKTYILFPNLKAIYKYYLTFGKEKNSPKEFWKSLTFQEKQRHFNIIFLSCAQF